MPAVTVSDITVLPRISAGTHLRARSVKSITTAPQGFEGEGFPGSGEQKQARTRVRSDCFLAPP